MSNHLIILPVTFSANFYFAFVGVHVLFVCGGSEESSLGLDHAHEMELLLENYFMQAEELGNKARELKGLIDDSESVIFINLDRYCTGFY